MIYAFDLATRTGWAKLGTTFGPTPVGSGWFDLKKSGADTWGGKLRVFDTWLRTVIPYKALAGRVVVEAPQQFKSRDAARVCWGLYTELCRVTDELGLQPPVEVSGPTLKKWATGSGKAKKPDMLKAANQIVPYGYQLIKDDNEADAVLLAHYASEELGIQ